MTATPSSADAAILCKKLLRKEPMGMLSGCMDCEALVNPDGPEAAAALSSLSVRVEELTGLLRRNVGSLQEQRERCKRWGKSHHEIDAAIEDSEQALKDLSYGG